MSLKINLKQLAPKNTYNRNGSECHLDPFRQMLVPSTPESLLLFKMEMYVHKVMGVPRDMMYVKQSFRKYGSYGVESSNIIDIVINDIIDGEIKPVAFVECKSPGVPLYDIPRANLEAFAKKMGINCLIVTNGTDVEPYISRHDRLSFWAIDKMPDYETICSAHKESLSAQVGAAAPKVAKASVKPANIEKPSEFNPKTTPKELQPVVMSLVNCLGDTQVRMKPQKIDAITIVGDWGLRKKLIGIGSEKLANTMLRTVLIKDFYDNHQLISFDVSPGPMGTPVLSVTMDDYDSRQVVMTMDLNSCLKLNGQKVSLELDMEKAFPHEKAEFVKGFSETVSEKAPYLMRGSQVVFGDIDSSDSIRMDAEDTSRLFGNVAAYALLLDEYREQLKIASRGVRKGARK
jgi:hypothetical protein